MTHPRPVELFVSYSHENAAWFKKLRSLLVFDKPTKVAHVWHDQKLQAGDRWDKEIREALEKMDVFICLLSYEFLASGYIMDVEVLRALEREGNNEVEIIPIVLFDMDLENDCPGLNAFNPLPAWGKCWRDYERDGGCYQDAHKPIRVGLRQVIDKVRTNHAPKRT